MVWTSSYVFRVANKDMTCTLPCCWNQFFSLSQRRASSSTRFLSLALLSLCLALHHCADLRP